MKKAGFALLELVTVAAIIIILAVIILRADLGGPGAPGGAPSIQQGEGALQAAKTLQGTVGAQSTAQQKQVDAVK